MSNFNHLNMFRAIISPNLRSTKLCLQLMMLPASDKVEVELSSTSTLSPAGVVLQPHHFHCPLK